MTDTPLHERRFSDQEVGEILKKAVERTPSQGLVRREGMSLADLKAIGEEVGIDPKRLEEAARAVILRGGNTSNRVLGAPTVLIFEQKVPMEFDPADTPEILAVIRRAMGYQGEVNEIHGSLEWTAKGDSGERYITLSLREGTTTILGSANLSNAAVLTFLPAGILGLVTSLVGLIKFVQDGSSVGLVVCLAVIPILYPILRTIFGKVAGAESAKLQQVVSDLARLSQGEEP